MSEATDAPKGGRAPYTLKSPCPHCPFRSDIEPYLRAGRAENIGRDLRDGKSFYCHVTVDYRDKNDDDEPGRGKITNRSRMCAGALITMENEERPNQIMRIAERLGLYDRFALDMDAPVYRSLAEWEASFREDV